MATEYHKIIALVERQSGRVQIVAVRVGCVLAPKP